MKLSHVAPLALLSIAALACGASAPSDLAGKIDPLFAKWNHDDTPGVIVAVARNGETVFARGYGMANLEHAIPLKAETISESGSVAKQFTAAAIVLLAQRGKLSLEDPVRRHLPELSPALADGITVRMLLNHTNGLRDIHGLFDLIGRPSYSSLHTNEEALQVMSRQRQLNFKPGTEYLYTNAAYILAAIIVQRASRQTFGAFCEEHVFKPNGMTHTRWRDDFTAVIPGRATGYDQQAGAGYRIDLPYSNLVGNGGLLTTVGDLLKWNAALDRPPTGEWAVVVKTLQTPSRLNDGRVLDYGLGLTVDEYAGVKEISHGGATSGYKTFLARFPERGVSFALLGNAGDFNPASVSRALARVILDLPRVPGPKRIQVAAEALSAVAGLYYSNQTADVLTLSVKDGKLLDDTVELIPTGRGMFANASGRTTFAFADARLTVTTHNGVVTYERQPLAKPTPAELAAYTGTFYSEELDVAHVVEVRAGRLSVGRWPMPALMARPTFADGFWFSRAWHATFTRDAAGAITGYELTNGRCRRVKFVRR